MGLPSTAFETTEWHTWVYDRSTADELLKIIERPSAEISFIVEPGRSDRIERGDIFERWREKVARRSIVNPEAIRDERAETGTRLWLRGWARERRRDGLKTVP
jgi:hypothetical protein